MRPILAIFVSILISQALIAQGKEDKSYVLYHIKTAYLQINRYKDYKLVVIDNSEDFLGHATDNGGTLTGYYNGDSLKKIVEWIGLSNRVVQNEYYFDNGKLIFVYSSNSQCSYNDSTEQVDCSRFDKVTRGRYYFKNEKLFDVILSDKEQEKTKQKDATDFLNSSREYEKLLHKKLN